MNKPASVRRNQLCDQENSENAWKTVDTVAVAADHFLPTVLRPIAG
jgi:hypothetical protein